jgi:hypothetical protein
VKRDQLRISFGCRGKNGGRIFCCLLSVLSLPALLYNSGKSFYLFILYLMLTWWTCIRLLLEHFFVLLVIVSLFVIYRFAENVGFAGVCVTSLHNRYCIYCIILVFFSNYYNDLRR